MLSVSKACEALSSGMCLLINYDGFDRLVEVHAVGISEAGNEVMRVWQVSGGSISQKPIDWKLLLLDKIEVFSLTDQRSLAPRLGYSRDDQKMITIFGQI